MNEFLQIIIHSLQALTPVDISLMLINILLLLFSKYILSRKTKNTAAQDESFGIRLKLFRSVIILIMIAILLEDVIVPAASHSWMTKIIAIPLIIYVIYLIFYLIKYLIRKRYGHIREFHGETIITDTYNSRILSILAAVFLTIFALVTIIQLLGFESLLHAGGMIGFIGVMLALTQASWAPDIISGLIILNSQWVGDGDTIQIFDDNPVIGSVFKVKLFYTEILDIRNNHRIAIKNSLLRDFPIRNLSRFSSPRGLREELQFNIGYDVAESKVVKMFAVAEQSLSDNPDVAIEDQLAMEVFASKTGDYAITWSLFYYIKEVQQIFKVRQSVRSAVIEAARQENISLATPILYSHSTSKKEDSFPNRHEETSTT